MVCYGFDPSRIEKIVSGAIKSLKNCYTIILLKDIETVQGQPDRIKKWVELVLPIVKN